MIFKEAAASPTKTTNSTIGPSRRPCSRTVLSNTVINLIVTTYHKEEKQGLKE
jgi:hypothetical protein